MSPIGSESPRLSVVLQVKQVNGTAKHAGDQEVTTSEKGSQVPNKSTLLKNSTDGDDMFNLESFPVPKPPLKAQYASRKSSVRNPFVSAGFMTEFAGEGTKLGSAPASTLLPEVKVRCNQQCN